MELFINQSYYTIHLTMIFDTNTPQTNTFNLVGVEKSKKIKIKGYEKLSERIPKKPKKRKFFKNQDFEEGVSHIGSTATKAFYHFPNLMERELNKHTQKLRSTGLVINYFNLTLKVRPDDRRTTLEVLVALSTKAESFLKFSIVKQIMLSFYSGITHFHIHTKGVYVCTGAMLCVYLSSGMPYYGIQRLFMAAGLSAGLIMSSLTGAALFTEQNVILPVNYIKFRKYLFKTIRFWLISFLGNCIGCAFMGLMFNLALAVRNKEVQSRLEYILNYKLQHIEYGVNGWWGIFLSG
jgi:hypothetical protein